MCWVWVAASWTRLSRWRKRERTAQTASGGRKEARRRPTEWRDLAPLAVLDVALPPRDVLDVAGVDQADRELSRLQELVEGDPVDPRGLHGDRGDAAPGEPVCEGVQVLREGPEAPDGLRVSVEGDADVDLGGPKIDPGSVRVQDRHGDRTGRVARASGHGSSSRVRGGEEGHDRQAAQVVPNSGYSSNRDRLETEAVLHRGRHQ